MFDFRKDKISVEQAVVRRIGQLCERFGYAWKRGNWWEKETTWCVKRCNLGLRQVGMTKHPELIGGASIFLPQYDRIYRRDDSVVPEFPSSLGSPVHWIDKRLDSNAGRFENMEELDAILPRFERAFEECVLPELERYKTEDDLLEALLSPEWLTSVKLSATQDIRGALVILMLAGRKGLGYAIEWGREEVERIRAEKPLVTSIARYQNILRCIEYLERHSDAPSMFI